VRLSVLKPDPNYRKSFEPIFVLRPAPVPTNDGDDDALGGRRHSIHAHDSAGGDSGRRSSSSGSGPSTPVSGNASRGVARPGRDGGAEEL